MHLMNLRNTTITNSMNSLLFGVAALLGACAIAWMAHDFAGASLLALAVTCGIGAVYLIGIVELLRFRRATASLNTALGNIKPQTAATNEWFGDWLGQLDPALRGGVRARIAGERDGLPAPVFTPYLVGLLVMLGLLGTFVGMVSTLGGAVAALQGSTELDAIRAGLAAPMQGLGVAFGTSVAGVGASAMLGLIATLARHERILATRRLDDGIASVFKVFSPAYQKELAFAALHAQAGALPAVAGDLQALVAQLSSMGDQLGESLLTTQERFQAATESRFNELANSVDRSLQECLGASARAAGEALRPILTETVADISQMLERNQQQQAQTGQDQLRSLGSEFGAAGKSLLDSFAATSSSWTEQTIALQDTIKAVLGDSVSELTDSARTSTATLLTEISGLLASTETLVEARSAAEAVWLDRLESTVATHLARLGQGLEAPMTRLIETASETPRAAAEVIGLLRAEIGNTVERDKQLLQERLDMTQDLQKLSASLQQAADTQRLAVENLVASSAEILRDISSRFDDSLSAGMSTLTEASVHVAGGAIEVNSLGEAFGHAVALFDSSNEAMMEHLSHIGHALEQSTARSDEQMAYYVAQAREIIDHSMLSQKEMMDDMRRIGRKTGQLAAGAQ